VEVLTADSERMLWRLVRAGNEAIDRHRDVQLQLAHRASSVDMLIGPPSASELIGQAKSLTTTDCAALCHYWLINFLTCGLKIFMSSGGLLILESPRTVGRSHS
jgi:hypothetical protein